MLHISINARQVLYRPDHEGQVRHECMYVSHRKSGSYALHPTIPDNCTERKRRYNLYGWQEKSREPGGTIRRFVHIIGQDRKLFKVFVLTPKGFYYSDTLYGLVILASNFRVCPA